MKLQEGNLKASGTGCADAVSKRNVVSALSPSKLNRNHTDL